MHNASLRDAKCLVSYAKTYSIRVGLISIVIIIYNINIIYYNKNNNITI